MSARRTQNEGEPDMRMLLVLAVVTIASAFGCVPNGDSSRIAAKSEAIGEGSGTGSGGDGSGSGSGDPTQTLCDSACAQCGCIGAALNDDGSCICSDCDNSGAMCTCYTGCLARGCYTATY